MEEHKDKYSAVLDEERPDQSGNTADFDYAEEDREQGRGPKPATDPHSRPASDEPEPLPPATKSRLPPLAMAIRRAMLLEWVENPALTSRYFAEKYPLGDRNTALRVRRAYGLPVKARGDMFNPAFFLEAARERIDQTLADLPEETRQSILKGIFAPGWIVQLDGLYPLPADGYRPLDAALTFYLCKAGLQGPHDLETGTDHGHFLHLDIPEPIFLALHLALAGRGAFLNRHAIRRLTHSAVIQSAPNRRQLEALAMPKADEEMTRDLTLNERGSPAPRTDVAAANAVPSRAHAALAIFYASGSDEPRALLPLAAKIITGSFLDQQLQGSAHVRITTLIDPSLPDQSPAAGQKNPQRQRIKSAATQVTERTKDKPNAPLAERFALAFPTLASLIPPSILASKETLWQRLSPYGLSQAPFDQELDVLLRTRQICDYKKLNVRVLPMIFVREFGQGRTVAKLYEQPEFVAQLSKLADLVDKSRRFARLMEINSTNAKGRENNPVLDRQTLDRWLAKKVSPEFKKEILRFYAKPPTACPVVDGKLTPAAEYVIKQMKITDEDIGEIFAEELTEQPAKPPPSKIKKRTPALGPH